VEPRRAVLFAFSAFRPPNRGQSIRKREHILNGRQKSVSSLQTPTYDESRPATLFEDRPLRNSEECALSEGFSWNPLKRG